MSSGYHGRTVVDGDAAELFKFSNDIYEGTEAKEDFWAADMVRCCYGGRNISFCINVLLNSVCNPGTYFIKKEVLVNTCRKRRDAFIFITTKEVSS